jgi:hypothetical protein
MNGRTSDQWRQSTMATHFKRPPHEPDLDIARGHARQCDQCNEFAFRLIEVDGRRPTDCTFDGKRREKLTV